MIALKEKQVPSFQNVTTHRLGSKKVKKSDRRMKGRPDVGRLDYRLFLQEA